MSRWTKILFIGIEIIMISFGIIYAFFLLILFPLTYISIFLICGFGFGKALQLRIPYVLRMIDESIEKIGKNRDMNTPVMLSRKHFLINKVIDYLDPTEIKWEIGEKVEQYPDNFYSIV